MFSGPAHLRSNVHSSKSVSEETTSEGGDSDGYAISFDASKSWEGSTSNDDTVNSDSYVGGG